MTRVAIIPARGGSKRIARKNIKPFHGLPIVAYSIRTALATGLFERVIVTTDDEEIARIAREHGGETPFIRPQSLSDDYAGTMEVVQHALAELGKLGVTPEFACCIYATAPFLQARYLREGLQLLEAQAGKSFSFSVTTFDFPVQRALLVTADGALDAMYPEYRLVRSQDLDTAWHDAGQFYWGRADAWRRGDTLFSPASLPVALPRHLVQDIDTIEDWQRAQWIYAALKAAGEIAETTPSS
ncbi:MAG: pseudaminic acid cytidylyltransferase [Paraburkholderia sp.]|nr:MAG: pseudaminic acid cytidylyltransferase [Paraburkholderia sp.]